MKHQSKHISTEQEQVSAQAHQTETPAAREFTNVEELLRYDAAQTTVPPGIAARLAQAAGELPKGKSSWWKRTFGGNQS